MANRFYFRIPVALAVCIMLIAILAISESRVAVGVSPGRGQEGGRPTPSPTPKSPPRTQRQPSRAPTRPVLRPTPQPTPGIKLSPTPTPALPRTEPKTTELRCVSAPARISPGPVVRNSMGMELVLIPPGSFCMGSNANSNERPVHQVTIKESFYMALYEVTQAQWQQLMGTTARDQRGANQDLQAMPGEGEKYPMYYVSWNDAQEFIHRLNERNDGFVYRLPTEAEWEYACRAGTTEDIAGSLDLMAWYGGDAGNSRGQTHPVGTKQPNAFGLYDMQGNVEEWCWDMYHDNYDGAPVDGSAWLGSGDQNDRVLRGGWWSAPTIYQRSAYRDKLSSWNRYNSHIGFRVVAVKANSATSTVRESKTPVQRGALVKNEMGILFVLVPAGSFVMGSNNGEANEKPVHEVTIKQGFYMSLSEVTQEEWQQVMQTSPSQFHDFYTQPVENVSWDDAQAFIRKLNEKRERGIKYRLPTEAEWEYACRAGTTGDYAGELDALAWYSAKQTHAVGNKLPNAFGLYDMHGNVWEWCQDVFHDSYVGAPTDGSAWLNGGVPGTRVLRGGSWYDPAVLVRSASRQGVSANDHSNGYGFRIVAEKGR